MDKRNREKYSRIINAGVNIFMRKGFYQTTVEEVAREAGVGKGTVYNYFANKEALFLAIIDDGIENLVNYVEESRDKNTDPRAQLQQAIRAVLDFFAHHREFCIFLVREHFSYSHSLRDQVEKFHQQHNAIFRDILEQCKEKGLFDLEYLDTLTAGITGAVFSSAFYWFMFREEFPVNKIYQTIEEMFFNNLFGE